MSEEKAVGHLIVFISLCALASSIPAVPATIGARAEAIVDHASVQVRHGRSVVSRYCHAVVDIQMGPNSIWTERLRLPEERCGSIKKGDRLRVRYILWSPWNILAAEDDGGESAWVAGLIFSLFAIFAVAVVSDLLRKP